MSIVRSARARASTATSSLRDAYRRSFVRHVHELIRAGYSSLDSERLQGADETDITGRLVAGVNQFLNKRGGPSWRIHFCVKDDPPVGAIGGRKRARVDIEFERTSPLPRPHFRFEAKRLHTRQCVSRYLGRNGLKCFTSKRYAADDDEAGMLAYVQTPADTHWRTQLQNALTKSPTKYRMRPAPNPWPVEPVNSGGLSFSSIHTRRRGRDLKVVHTLLRFY